ncbi:hypothetical protein N7463_008689 [Penicillium fimorum]|uniref:Uncharacterized protein n=1 Tax=Penicillium fimorum TaxID=1882269 RepID=A0A9X0C3I1_9EURO|nr:hypothetical protein N7463_008689 [Penicillium fimorum]
MSRVDLIPVPDFDTDLVCLKLRWGVVEKLDDEDSNSIGHAIFTAGETTHVIEGKLYDGSDLRDEISDQNYEWLHI